MNTFFLALFQPVKAFSEAKAVGKFPTMSLIIVLFLLLINLILMVPIVGKVTALTFSSLSLPANQIDTMIQVTHKMRYMQVAGSEILYIVMFLFYAFLLYVFARLAKSKLEYKQALLLITYSYFIVVIGDLVNTLLLYIRGIDAITNVYDTSLMGLNMLTSVDAVGATLYTFFSYFTPFQLEFIILLSIGLNVFTGMNCLKSMIISVLFWLITILIPTFSVYYSQLTIAKTGML